MIYLENHIADVKTIYDRKSDLFQSLCDDVVSYFPKPNGFYVENVKCNIFPYIFQSLFHSHLMYLLSLYI